MVVLDSFPFQEDSDVQYLGGVRRPEHSGGHHSRREIYLNSREPSVVEPGNYLSHGNEQETRIERPEGYMEGVENAQGYMKCRLCHYQTKVESLLRRHVIKHSLDSDFRCPACDFRENDPGKFVDHIGTHQSGKLVRCCFCPKKMARAKLKSHIRIHRTVELYDCSMCQFSTNYEKTIKSHMDVYHTKEYSCHQCNLIMTKHDLHWHMKFVHSMEPAETAAPEATVPLPVPAGRGTNSKTPPNKFIPYQSMLSRKFGASKTSRKTSIALKMQKHVAKKQFNCGKCDYKTAFKKLLRAHRAKHSLDNSLICTKCGFKETGPGKFATHLALHSPSDLFECCFCGFQTPTRGTMSNHVSKHKPVPMFDCPECEFSAKRPASVRIHTANVHRKKSRCGFCGLEMSRLAMLDHIKDCHSGEVLEPGSGPSAQSLEPEHYELEEPATPVGDFNQKDENTVSCEFCSKPYAKSYLRKHIKKCQIENAPHPDTKKSNAISPELQPFGKNLASDAALENPKDATKDPEPEKSPDFGLLKSQVESNNKPKKPRLQCNSCFFKTTKKRLLKKHVVKHLIDFRLTCPECGHKEMSAFKFAHHILQHGSDPDTFQCCFCPLSSPTSKRSYCAHLELHRPVNIFDCPKCEYSSNRADTIRNHCKNNHLKNRKCPHCGEIMSKARLIKHLLESHGETRNFNFKLPKADGAPALSHPQKIKPTNSNSDHIADQTTFEWQNSEDGMQGPAEISHAEDDPPNIETPLFETVQDLLKCTKCTFQTKIQSLMDRHVAKHLQDVPFVCPLCGFGEMSSRKFANHWDKHECNAKKKIYQCCFCDTEIKKKHCLKAFLPQHIEDHRAVALQDCSECEFSSHSRYELDKHFKNQHVKKCECLLCGEVMTIFEHSFHTECKGTRPGRSNGSRDTANSSELQSVDFSTLRRRSAEVQESVIAALEDPASLIDADNSSTRVRPASRSNCVTKQYMHCSSCNYKTAFKSLLKRHALKHLMDVPFSCKNCSFSSFDERTFADHIFTHSNSYKCHLCSYRAGNATAATRHFSSHKVLAMQDCPKCEYTSTYKYRLVEHLKGKHLNVPRCSYCGQKMSKEELYSHERECGRSLRSNLFGQSKSSSEIPADRLTQALDGTSPRVFAKSNEHVMETPSMKPVSGLIGEPLTITDQLRGDDSAMKGLLLHQLNLAPTQGHVDYDAKISQLSNGCGMLRPAQPPENLSNLTKAKVGSASERHQHTDKKVEEMPTESTAVTYLPCQDPDLKHPVLRDPVIEMPTLVESNSASVMMDQDSGLIASVSPNSLTKISAHADIPGATQELKSAISSQVPRPKHTDFPTSKTEISTVADHVVRESDPSDGQNPGLIDSVCSASLAEMSSLSDLPAVIQDGKSVSCQDLGQEQSDAHD